MRRLIGAAIIFTAIALPRVGELIHKNNANLMVISRPVTDTLSVGSKKPRRSTPGSVSRNTSVPETYHQNPLQFLSDASIDSLVLLPGIGPVIAERIANARTGKRSFTRWEELLDIKGIGPKKLDRLKRLAEETD